MSREGAARIISRIYDAVAAPERWPTVLKSIIEAGNGCGGGLIITDQVANRIDWATFIGPLLEARDEYIAYYAVRSPLRPLFDTTPLHSWIRLSRVLPRPALQRSEWYNDLCRKRGVVDILAIKLFDIGTHRAVLGIQKGVGSAGNARTSPLQQLIAPLTGAVRLHHELRSLGWKSSLALRALDHMAAGIIIADEEGRVIEMNRAADSIIAAGDGIALRSGRLTTERSFENAKLQQMIAAAAVGASGEPGRLLVRKRGSAAAYMLTVTPLSAELALGGRPMAMIVLADPDDTAPSEVELADFYGLSPAESRLGAALSAGKTLSEISAGSGVRITTLRTQLRSVLRKVGVERQADLVRVLSRVHMAGPR